MMRLRLSLPFLALLVLSGCSLPRWPVESVRITSDYGLRFHGWKPDQHRGMDLAASLGTPIHAVKGGRVRYSGVMSGYGKVIILEHRGQMRSLYAHLSERRVSTGARVKRGAVIGLSGQSGNARGPHLHFELWKRDRPVDPMDWYGLLFR